MPYVTIHTLDGDADDLWARKAASFDPAVRETAPSYGAIASVCAKTETGLVIVNVWESAEQVPQFTAHPAVQAARDSRTAHALVVPAL